MESKQIEQGKKVKWDDWIGRLIGYLGEYEYKHGRQEVDLEYAWSGESKADNIVYIYGAEKSGMEECIDLLSEELNGRQEFVCYGYSFERTDTGKASLNFQNEFKEAFRQGAPKFQFPCLRLLTAAEEHNEADGVKETLSNLLDVSDTLVDSVETLATGSAVQKFFAGKDLVKELWESKDYLRNMIHGGVEAEAVKRLKAKLRDLAFRGSVVSAVSMEMPYDCLQMDLQINVKSIKKRVICTVNAFELSENRFADSRHRELLLKMMASVPGVVWVLFSSKMPDDEARSIIRRENFWRMGGISKERTIHLLEKECPDAEMKWCKAVYHYTGGLVGLLNLCVDAHHAGHKYVVDRGGKLEEMLRFAKSMGNTQLIEQLMQMKEEQEAFEESEREAEQDKKPALAEENKQDAEQQELERWFTKVWNGSFKDDTLFSESERDKKDPLDFLFGTGRIDFVEMPDDGTDASVRKYFLPCLCYLIKKSMEDVGTVEQYHWQRRHRHQNLELNELGVRCMLVVEEEPLFCKEYEEYPGVLYLDPIIVQVVSKHRNFEKWLQAFEERCIEQKELAERKNTSKHTSGNSSNVILLVDEDGKVHNVKLAEPGILKKNAGIMQGDLESLLEQQTAFSKEEPEKPAQPPAEDRSAQTGGETPGSQTQPEFPVEQNDMDKSYRARNAESGTMQPGAKRRDDKKQMDDSESAWEDKEQMPMIDAEVKSLFPL